MRFLVPRLSFTAVLAFGLFGSSEGSVVTYMGRETLVRLSPVIVHGTVASVAVVPSRTSRAIHTDVRISVVEMLRGPADASEISVRLLGGRYGDREARVFGVPRFLVGEEVVVFARPTKAGWLTVTGLFQGKISIDRSGGEVFASRASAASDGPVLVLPRGAQEPVRAPFASWLRQIRRLILLHPSFDRWRAAEPANQQSDAVAADDLQAPDFTLLIFPIRRFEPDVGAPVTYFYNPTNAPPVPGGARAAFVKALQAWSAVTGAAIELQDGGDTGAQCFLTFDGVTGVSHGDPCGEVPAFDTASCSGVLALGGLSEIALFQRKMINGVNFLRGVQGDVVFNDGADCFYSGPGNYEEVMTHEIGHTMGLGHSCGDNASPACGPNPVLDDAQMRAFAHGDGRGASPRRDDVKGLRFIYPPAAFVELHAQDTSLTTGESMQVTLDLNGTTTADLWFVLFTPAGPIGGLGPSGLQLGYAVDISVLDFTFTGSEPAGVYAAWAALTVPGQHPSDPGAILSSSAVSVTFTP